MKQLHEIQLKILHKLLFSNGLRYTQMKPSDSIENNQFQFHLDQLQKEYKYIKKEGQKYQLTSSGKEYANRLDMDDTQMKHQAKISVWMACTRKHKGKEQVLIYTRLKQPFYGHQGFPSGKVKFGETIQQAAIRELEEETSLVGKPPRIIAIAHFRVFEGKERKLVEDKFMHLCHFNSPQGNLKPNNEGDYEWIDANKLSSYLTKPFEDKKEYLKYMKMIKNFKGCVTLIDADHFTESF